MENDKELYRLLEPVIKNCTRGYMLAALSATDLSSEAIAEIMTVFFSISTELSASDAAAISRIIPEKDSSPLELQGWHVNSAQLIHQSS